MKVALLCSVLAIMLTGCAATPTDKGLADASKPAWYPEYRSTATSTPMADFQAVTTLTDAQKKAFRAWYASSFNEGLTPAQRVVEYLKQSVWGFTYRGDTLTASQTMEKNAGNCLSLALLTAALADEIGVDISFQEDISDPVYKQKGALMLMAKHVRATVRDTQSLSTEHPQLSPRVIYVDYYAGKVHGKLVDRNELLGMYYRNKAAEHLASQDKQKALADAEKAWMLDKSSAESINLMAVVLTRVGQDEAAEQFYRFGIENSYDNLMLRENYVAYLTRDGRQQEANRIAATIADANERNPYNLIWRAREAFENEHFSLARKLYEKAREVAPYMVESYHGLASVYVKIGRYGHAQSALEQAVKKSWDDEEKQRYQDKLYMLNAMLDTE